ncbi:SCO family protein [Rhodobacteraceae bacterium]|nr:SCO family protein [Paracoccaceae bacterium]
MTLGSALLGCSVIWWGTDGFRAITAETARRLHVSENPRLISQYQLQTMAGDWKSLKINEPTLIEFIYTTCASICQTSGGDFAELRDHLAKRGLTVPMISISFDPETDDVNALRQYAEIHGASGDPWTVARPVPANLKDLLNDFDVLVIRDDWGGYEHNVAVLMINSEGRFSRAFDTRDFEQISEAVKTDLGI